MARSVNWSVADNEFISSSRDQGFLGKIYSKLVDMRGIKNQALRGSKGKGRQASPAKETDFPTLGARSLKKMIADEVSQRNNAVTTANVAMSRKVAMTKPKYRMRNGSVIISHSEYIAGVNGSTTYTATTYNANPGLSSTFPWLSSVADNYAKYRFRRLSFLFVPSTGTNTAGRIALAFNVNAIQPAPPSKGGLFSITPNDEEAVWAECAITKSNFTEDLFIRQFNLTNTSTTAGTGDLKTYDCGKLIVATDLGASTAAIGELYVSYEVELKDPIANLVLYSELYNPTATAGGMFSNTTTVLIGPAIICNNQNTNNTFNVNVSGVYSFTYVINGTGLTGKAVFTIGSGTGTYLQSSSSVGSGTTTTLCGINIGAVTVDQNSQYAPLLITVTNTTITSIYLYVTQIPSGVTWV